MNILLYVDNLGAGGAQRQLCGLAVLLSQQGLSVKVCTYYSQDFFGNYLAENHVSWDIIPGAASTLTRVMAAKRYFMREKPDWIIAYQETPSLVACLTKLLGCKSKLIVSERNTTQTVGLRERLRFFLYHYADTIVPNSYAQGDWLTVHYPWMITKISTITNFVDLEKFFYVDHTRRDVPEFVVAASLMHSKNAIGFIEACALLKQKNIHFHVSWYGISTNWPEYHGQCLNLISQRGLNDTISILEKTQDIAEKYRDCDYFCLPSFFEGTPNVICEAIATGLPIACSDISDNHLYVHDGENGILFDPNSPIEMAEKIAELLSQSEDEYQKYRRCSRTIAEAKLTKEDFVYKYLSILN